MKFKVMIVLGIFLLAGQVHAQKAALKSQKEKVSYIIGMGVGKNFKQQSVDVDPDAFAKGLRDALSDSKPLLTEQEINETMVAYKKEMAAKLKEQGEKNKKQGEAFLAENKKKPEVKVLPSGLQYKVLRAGKGQKPKLTDTVIVQYRGRSSMALNLTAPVVRGNPQPFPLNR